MSKKLKPSEIVYSTNPDFVYNYENNNETKETLPPDKQLLKVSIDRKQRGGKVVTLITGFVGSDEDLQILAKMLKTRLGVGGSAKDGEIIIQGEHKEKIVEILEKQKYKCKRVGG